MGYPIPKQALSALSVFTGPPHSLNQDIVGFLVAQYQRKLKEELLDCALPYHGTLAHPQLVSYQQLLNTEKQIISCFARPRLTKLKGLPTLLRTEVPKIRNHAQLYSRLARRLTEEVKEANQQEATGQLAPTFEALVTAFPTHETFKVLGAHHLCDWCISGLNEESMTHTVALDHLLRGWNWVPDDQRLAANLAIVFGLLCKATTTGATAQKAELEILEKTYALVSANRNQTIRQELTDELIPIEKELHLLLRMAKIDLEAVVAAAQLGYSTRFSADGLALGKKLLIMRKMTALAI